MGYATVGDLINEAASFYNDTDAINYVLPDSTKRRLLHYVQRTVDEIWYYRPWNFKMLLFDVVPANGEAALPANFATVGPKGSLTENGTQLVWTEVDFQEWSTLRLSGRASGRFERVFTIGSLTDGSGRDAGEGSPNMNVRSILFPDVNESREFTLMYEGTPPKAGWDAVLDAVDYTQPLPLSEGFHNTLLLGTIAKLQESKGDPRPAFRSEYVASLAQAAAQHLPLTSRMQQLPRAIPGGMW